MRSKRQCERGRPGKRDEEMVPLVTAGTAVAAPCTTVTAEKPVLTTGLFLEAAAIVAITAHRACTTAQQPQDQWLCVGASLVLPTHPTALVHAAGGSPNSSSRRIAWSTFFTSFIVSASPAFNCKRSAPHQFPCLSNIGKEHVEDRLAMPSSRSPCPLRRHGRLP